jgi:HPt (histidine-containing phosphotransfer) domain-containing protein
VDAALAQVPGLDAATGLSRVAGNHALYRQLLKQFVERQGDAPARVAQALAAGEPAAAQRAAHTVRAVAGNLGLATLQQAAAALEQALAHSEPHGEQLTAFEHQLHDALQSLGAALRESDARASAAAQAAATQAAQADAAAQAQAQAGTGAADQALATEHATTLARLLAADDAEAADFFAAQRDAFRALLDAPALAALERALADFDFDAALQQLQAAVPMGDVVP